VDGFISLQSRVENTKTTEGITQTVAKQKCAHDNHMRDVIIIHQKKNKQKGTAVGGRRGFPFCFFVSVMRKFQLEFAVHSLCSELYPKL
jgi:hypothetical protein